MCPHLQEMMLLLSVRFMMGTSNTRRRHSTKSASETIAVVFG
jgi:hypothetical protein